VIHPLNGSGSPNAQRATAAAYPVRPNETGRTCYAITGRRGF
jgi:hypothetical protein